MFSNDKNHFQVDSNLSDPSLSVLSEINPTQDQPRRTNKKSSCLLFQKHKHSRTATSELSVTEQHHYMRLNSHELAAELKGKEQHLQKII